MVQNLMKISGHFGFFLVCFLFFLVFFLLIYLFLAALGLCCCALAFSSCASGGYSSLRCMGFSLRWLLLLQSTGYRRAGFSSCSAWAQQLWLAGSRAQAQQLWCTGLVAPRHVGSSRTRAQTRVPCVASGFLTTAPPGKSGILFFKTKRFSSMDTFKYMLTLKNFSRKVLLMMGILSFGLLF